MKKLLFLSFTIFSVNCYSQIVFEKGYYINNEDQKVDCLIKNIDWADNPVDFKYKLSENGEVKTATIESVKEFGVNNVLKYIRKTVKIDRSSESITELSNDKNPIFKEEELFLNALVEGKANLYLYESGGLRRFFYSKDSSVIEQLVFKSYKTEYNQIGTNNRYKQQLWNDLKYPDLTMNKIENLHYNRKELVDFFVSFNKYNNHEVTSLFEKQKKDLFNLNLRPGLNYSSLSIHNDKVYYRNIDFGNEYGFRFGIETEFLLPFNKNKWAIIIEPTYQYFKSEKEIAKVDFEYIDLPLGIRHYFFFSKNSKVFINCSLIFNNSRNSVIDFDSGIDLEINTRNNWAFGFGYKHNNKYSLELSYQTSREILSDYLLWTSDFKTLSVLFGYSIF